MLECYGASIGSLGLVRSPQNASSLSQPQKRGQLLGSLFDVSTFVGDDVQPSRLAVSFAISVADQAGTVKQRQGEAAALVMVAAIAPSIRRG